MSTEAPNCWRCRFFAVSWDPKCPYACQLMGFKSKILPCLEVIRADGLPCMGYQAKPAPKTQSMGVSEPSKPRQNPRSVGLPSLPKGLQA
jgi:hypothetical protein